ncbi:Glycosyltransferase involved in cell wall bisynthesis [Kaistia soli DSM 19436]|uniref:Glycosyltransferase involved in cell wall bisynthesis n=1 Tax=Kaistia soli DSM 19436 TaxID=1122133 RepID=A0A1M5NF46_9HYPH|nr:glycosyltransferase [Kaistia soli]SHG88148.1 Glycosyltransferase involved in cell wall bisynthesis [Kaistia soli DSM 19436]
MRILRVIASVDPEHGGPIEGLKRSSAVLAETGHVTEVASCDDPAARYVAEFPFSVHALGPSPSRYGYTPRLTPWIRDNAHRFDAAVVHGLWNYASIGAWRALRNSPLPYVIFTHGMLDPWFNTAQPVKRWAKQAYWLAGQSWVLARARSVLFTSEEERRLARTAFWGPSYTERVVSYGAAEPPEGSEAQQAAFRDRVPELGDRPYLLFLSRIHPKKGCDLLVTAFARVAALQPDLQLVLAGPDPVGLKAELIAAARSAGIADRLHFPGMLRDAAKWGAFRGALAFVLPSHQENFGIVVAEAMSCGVPVLITNKVNIWREVAAAGAGLVADDTAEGIEAMLRDFLGASDTRRAALRSAARRGYEAHFSIGSAAADLEAVLAGLSVR